MPDAVQSIDWFAIMLWGETRATFCIAGPIGGPRACSFAVDQFTLVFWGIVLFGTAVVALLGTAAIAEGRTPHGEWNFLLLSSAHPDHRERRQRDHLESDH